MTTLVDLGHEIGTTEVIDILLMALFIYAGFLWLRRSRANKLVQGILITGLLYLAARQLNLFLTSAIFEAFFAVALVALIVVFRDELRRMFERVARLRPAAPFGRKKEVVPPASVEVLVKTVFELARDEIGALIVLKGTETIDSHLEGGVRLNGELSEALLKSLFDVHSIGHDGAVVVERGVISRFACHLPLSTNFDRLGSRGTRHAAALGLSERSDALILVVSEERGEVSCAHAGELRPVSSRDELARLIARQQKGAPQPRVSMLELIFKDVTIKIAALVLSMLLWLVLVFGAKQTLRRQVAPIIATEVPGGMVATVTPPSVTLTLAGSRRNFYFFDPGAIHVSLSLSGTARGISYKTVHFSDVTVAKDLVLRDVRPARVRVRLRRAPPKTDNTKLRR